VYQVGINEGNVLAVFWLSISNPNCTTVFVSSVAVVSGHDCVTESNHHGHSSSYSAGGFSDVGHILLSESCIAMVKLILML
jgi:hypothetical protein